MPGDASMIRQFHKERESFERLVKMFREDSEFHSISSYSHSISSYSYDRDKLPPIRLNEYMNLLKKASGGYGIRRARETGEIYQIQVSTIMLDDSDPYQVAYGDKGCLYSSEELSPLLNNLDRPGNIKAPAYKKIEGNWYLYYEETIAKPE